MDREVWDDSANADAASGFRSLFQLATPSGASIQGVVSTYAKNGNLAGGNGIYGDGNVCLFSGSVDG